MESASERLGPSLPATFPEHQCEHFDYSAALTYSTDYGTAQVRVVSALNLSTLGGDACSEPETME